MIPAATAINVNADKVLYIGRSPGGVDARDCSGTDATPRPVQQVVVVDAQGGGATRIGDLITISVNGIARTTQMPNGTRLKDLIRAPDCLIGGVTYAKYEGTVD